MSIIPSFTIKSLKSAPAKTIVTILGIALSSALLVAVMTTLSSAYDCLVRGEIAENGNWVTRVSVSADQPVSSIQEALNAATGDGILENSAVITHHKNIELKSEYSKNMGAFLPVLSARGDIEKTCGISPEVGNMPTAATEIMLPISWQRKNIFELGDTVSFDADTSFTVCGFYTVNNNTIISFPDGGVYPAALISENSAMQIDTIDVYLSFKDASSIDEINTRTELIFPENKIAYHNRLLLFEGITPPDSAAYESGMKAIDAIVGVLAAVIVLACVSVIYNAFAISVNERMRQFGLLSSIGASRRQLRNSVLFESLIMCIAGCTLGVAIGLGACAITFSALGDGLASLFAGGAGIDFRLAITWQSIALAVGLTLLTVLASAAIPALRAARVSPVAALRQSNSIKITRRAQRKAQKSSSQIKPWRSVGISRLFFGIGGQISAITHARNASKGRAASVSLAVALVLLLTASSLMQQMNTVLAASGVDKTYDIAWIVNLQESDANGNSLQTSTTKEDLVNIAEYLGDQAASIDNSKLDGLSLTTEDTIKVPKSLAGPGLVAMQAEDKSKGTVEAITPISYIPDDKFLEAAKSAGVSISIIDLNNAALAKESGFVRTESGAAREKYFSSTGEIVMQDGDNVTNVNIIALVDKVPGVIDAVGSIIVMPFSALPAQIEAEYPITFRATLTMSNPNATEDELEKAIEALQGVSMKPIEEAKLGPTDAEFINYKAQALAMKRLINAMTTFCFLFALIVSLIALANVFNTITNGLILRRREFAVLESIGMAPSQFRRMIASETCGYAIRGMIPGILLGCLASFGLFEGLGIAIEGIGFSLPWAGIGISLALVFVVIAISLVYGIHRALAGNTASALRME